MKPTATRFSALLIMAISFTVSGCLVSSKQVAINLDVVQELPPESAIAWLQSIARNSPEKPCRFSAGGIEAPSHLGKPIGFAEWTTGRETLLTSKGYKASYYDLFQVVDSVHAHIHIRPRGVTDRAAECTVLKRDHRKFTQSQFEHLKGDFEKTLTALISLGVLVER